nr:hypothetical protein K-LCC10_0016 [Kaumoebavirus]
MSKVDTGFFAIFKKEHEYKIRQQIMTGAEEMLVFAVQTGETDKTLIRPCKEELIMGMGFRDYVIRIKIPKDNVENLMVRTVTGWAPASHLIVSVREC